MSDPIGIQYFHFLKDLAHGNLGFSLAQPQLPVRALIRDRLPTSMALGGMALLVILFIGVPLGFWVGELVRRGKGAVFHSLITYMVSIPTFLVCAFFIPVFSMGWPLSLLAPSVFSALEQSGILLPTGFWQGPRYWILPVLCLSFHPTLMVVDLVSTRYLEINQSTFVGALKAKGLSSLQIFFRHLWPLVLLPVLSYLGPVVAGLLTGSFVVETVFAIPGLASQFLEGILQRDYPVVQGLALLFSGFLMISTALTDFLGRFFSIKNREAVKLYGE